MVGCFLLIGSRPHAAAGSAAMPVAAVGLHFDEIVNTLLNNPARLFIIGFAKVPLQFPAVLTGVMPGKDLARIDRLIQLDAP